MILLLIKRAYRLFTALFSTPFKLYFKYYDSNSYNVIWIMGFDIKYLFKTSIIWDLATINSLINSKQTFAICINNKIGLVSGKRIFFTIHSLYNVFGFKNYVSIFPYLLKELEYNDNILIPSLQQTLFWENKAFMHRRFDELGVPAPKTVIVSKNNINLSSFSFKFPFLIKLIHSYESKGIFKITNLEEFNNFLINFKEDNQEFLIQEILNMRKDIRIIFANNKIHHFYWRINNSKEWRPTATSKGNSVDFLYFPDDHRDTIEEYAKKLNMSIGAFDVAWENDDLSGTPLVLEVSPVFSPNPIINETFWLNNYGEFKKHFSLNGYDYLYVKEIFRLKNIHLKNNIT
jgi:hypothetical protein